MDSASYRPGDGLHSKVTDGVGSRSPKVQKEPGFTPELC